MKNTIITNTKRQLLMLCAALCCAVMWGTNPTAPDISAVNETSYQLTVNSGANGVTSVTYFVDSTDEIPETGDTRQYSVIEGVEVSFTFTPSSEYSVGSVTVDGVDVTASLQPGMTSPTVKTYTLAPMSADVTVQVTYAKNYTDGEVFTAQTIEGVNMDFKVISAADMTCQVGDGSHSSIADGVTVVTVPSVVNGFTVTTVGSNAFWRGAFGALTTVTLPSTITSIGNNAFESCGALTAIVIPEAVTTIGDNAFLQCYDLASVTMPPTITYIGESAFKSTPSLTSIELPTSITTISAQAFYSSGLTSITIPEGVTSIGESAFNSCSSLATVNFPTSLLTIGKGAFSLNSALTAINLPSQLQTIGESAFLNCELVTSITIPASVTTIESWGLSIGNLKWVTVEGTTPPTITENSFSGGTTGYGVLYVQQDAIDTYHASEYWNVFNRIYAIGKHPYAVLEGNTLTFYCDDQREARTNPMELNFTSANNSPIYPHKDEITSVVFDDSFADFTELTSTANWFYDCGNLTSITGLEKVNTSKVTTMEYMFDGCRSLTSLDISNFDLSSVQTMSCMFRSCSGLTNINLGNFNASSTTSFSQMFQGCTSLETINISDANTSSATTMYAMFNGCRALTELNLGSFNTANVTNMSMMFANCNALKTIYVGSGWTTAAVTDNGTGMFSDCNNLEGGAGTTWASMAAAYVENCNNYQFAHIDGGTSNPGYLTDVADYGKVEEPYAVLSDENTKLTFYYDKHKEQNNGMDVNFTDNTLRGWNSSASYITEVVFDPSFANCTTLTSTAWLFWSMGNLTTITGIENLKTDNVTNMHMMFNGCSKLTSLDVSSFKTDNVVGMYGMFSECTGLTSLDLSSFNTASATDMGSMFSGCNSLTSLDVSSFNTANVTNMAAMFMNCTGLTTLDLSSFNTAKVENMDNMFCQNSLTTIYVDGTKWNTGAVTSSISMFYMCPNLVGGQGTVYDINRVDASYAHIDGGTSNPGYFTPKSGYVEAPTFAWSADELTMTSGTDGATIYYTLTDAVTSTPTPTQYTAPITVTSDVLIEAYAEKDGMARSMTTTLNYPYTAWKALVDAIADAQNVLAQANTNDNVTAEQRDSLVNFINTAQGMYEARIDSAAAITQFTTDLITLTETVRQAVEAIAEPYAVLSDNGIFVDPETGDEITAKTLTFYYDTHKEDHSGMDVGVFANENENPWYTYRASITTVVFDESFASFTELTSTAFWFNNFGSLTTITGISNLKTDNLTDMKFMFNSCSGLTSLDLSSFNTGNVTDMSNMFLNCSGLTSLNLSSFNTSNVTNMRNMFNGCSSLTSLDLSSFNTANVTDMGYMFSYCSGLTGLDLSNFNTANVMYMPEMFSSCSSLATLDLSNFNTSNVPSMHSMFYNCSSLTTLDLSSFNTASVTDMSNMFQACSSLISLDLSSFNTANVTTMYFMLSNCSNLTTIYVGEGWSTENVTQSGGMFYDCTALVGYMGTTYDVNNIGASYAHIDGGAANPGYFTDINAPTSYVVTLKAVGNGTVKTGDTTVGSDSEQDVNVAAGSSMILAFTPDAGYRLATVMVDSTDVTSQVIADSTGVLYYTLMNIYDAHTVTATFVNNTKEAYAVLSADNSTLTYYYDTEKESRGGMSVTEISHDGAGFTDNREWADHVNDITRVIFDQSFADYTELTSTACWFANMESLETIEGLEYLNTANVTDMSRMFYDCFALTTLDLRPLNTENVTDMSWMLAGCHALTSLDLTNLNTAKLTNMHSMFFECSSLSGVDVTNFNTQNVTTMVQVFSRCENLTSLDLRSFNTENVTGMGNMFEGCTKLTTVDLSSFNTTNVKGMVGMFANCSALETLDLSSFNTSKVEEIAVMFGSASSLRTIFVGSAWDMTNIRSGYGAEMFRECNALIGGKGTVFDANHTDYTYAHIDGGTSNPGYFTDRNASTESNDSIQIVGNKDLSSAWWTAFSKDYVVPADYTLHVQFVNHSAKENNWENWAMICAADTTRTPEYFALRADNYGWGDYHNANGLTINWNDWDAFREGMDGAVVDLTVRRWGSEVRVTSNALTTSGDMLTQVYTTNIDVATEKSIDVFFTVEKSYLEIDNTKTTLTPTVPEIAEAYAVLSGDSITLTFYYDKKREERGGRVFQSGTEVYWPNYVTGVTKVSFDESFADFSPTSTSNWFAGFNSLTSVEGMEYLNTEHVTSMISMFQYCENLTALDLSRLQTGHVETMTNMFYGCKRLANLNLSSFSTSNVTSLASMFYGCQSLTMIDLSSFNTSNVTRMEEMFQDCAGLTTLDLTNFNTENVENMTLMFAGCTNLATIYAGSGWSVAKAADSRQMFYDCTSLVGGQGTVYDAEYTDKTYAHIDGGTSNPGYLTLKLAMGDANGDGNINIADAVSTVTNILGLPTEATFYKYAADMNTDQVIDIFDVTLIVNAAFDAASPAPAMTRGSASNIMMEHISMTADADYIYLGIDQPERFTATQFDVTLPEGMELVDARLASASTDHQLTFVKRGDNEYRVIGLSMSNTTFRSMNGQLIKLEVSGSAVDSDVKMSNVLFVTPTATVMTSIDKCLNTAKAADDSLYDLKGQRLSNQQLGKGIYIMNHKKVIIK